jgi:1-acyl-sn-glycerol-3-phosphate acyltransferase
MTGLFTHPLRVAGRLVWLAAEVGAASVSFVLGWLPGGAEHSRLERRALWLQRSCRRVLRILNVDIQVAGPVPQEGLLISNHLSYLDILVLSSLTPALFVAKREVRGLPVFGWLAAWGGTLFIDRERRSDVARLNQEIKTVLRNKVVLVLFPEGTSSDGQTVLPFKSSLLEPAAQGNHDLSVSRISYCLRDGKVEEEVCYWRDMTMLPHVINLLSKRAVEASVSFNRIRECSADRKELARQMHAEILRLQSVAAQ